MRWLSRVALLWLAATLAQAQQLDDPADLEPFVDGVMRAEMNRDHVAGAVISVVKDGRLVFAKGYGYADVPNREPVDPDKTLFRIASITKTFTWLAVMQQVERGNLDLDADINAYLADFQIPSTYPEPITLTHLMTHTPGFEDKIIGLFARRAEDLRPLPETLADEMPARVRPPGQFIAYSNHGAAMAGYIVGQVAGMPWEDYVETRILNPLNLRNATPRQPIPEPLAAQMSRGYIFRNGRFEEQPFQFMPTAPAGVMSISAADMAAYMNMLLDYGAHPGGRLMSRETGEEMMSTLFTHDPRISGNAHGFMEHRFNGMRFVGHGGSTMIFHSYLLLNHDERFGLFVSENTQSGGAFSLRVIRAILDRYYPAPPLETLAPAPNALESAAKVAGDYGTLRHEYTGAAKISSMMPMSVARVTVEPDGAILVVTPEVMNPVRYVETEPFLYREENGAELIAFRQGEGGPASHLFLGNTPYFAYERLAFHETAAFTAGLLGAVLTLFAVSLVVWPIRAALRIRRGDVPDAYKGRAAVPRLFAWALCSLHIVFLLRLSNALSDPLEIVFGMPEAAQNALAMTVPLAVASAAMAVLCVWAYKHRCWSRLGRLHYALLTLAALALVGWEHYWNFLGQHY